VLAPVPLQASGTPRPANTPPATNPRRLGSLKTVSDTLRDVAIDAEIVADGMGDNANGAETSASIPTWKTPRYRYDASDKITRFRTKFKWRGTITIQTVYGGSASAQSVSCYGRGTTTRDVSNRDITLGFHEHCHREDLRSYLANHALPDPPTFRTGMSKTEFRRRISAFDTALTSYSVDMHQTSEQSTDEVGHRRSSVADSGCYVHTLPPAP
jgi:hypothetical protein